MSAFTRRSFIGTAAAAVGSFATLQKVVGADRSRSDPGPANPRLDGQNPESIFRVSIPTVANSCSCSMTVIFQSQKPCC